MFGRCSGLLAVALLLPTVGCRRDASAEDARVCVQRFVVQTWDKCKTTDVRCDVSEMEITGRNDVPSRSEVTAEAPIHFRPVSGDETTVTARFTVALTPNDDGTFACAEILETKGE